MKLRYTVLTLLEIGEAIKNKENLKDKRMVESKRRILEEKFNLLDIKEKTEDLAEKIFESSNHLAQ